jgi:signal transduction histidine kinase
MPSYLLIPLMILCIITIIFVGWEVLERRISPEMSIGMRHFLLTLRAFIVTAVASLMIYIFMRCQNRRLSSTAEKLAQVLETHMNNPKLPCRFENPNLQHCRDVLNCGYEECPMFDKPGERCWQVMALSGAPRDNLSTRMEIEKCHECEVYRQSCPDKLTELGESFNNLMFLLREESRQVGQMRAQMVEREKMVSIGQLASGIAHEVGNPLSSISSIVQMVKRSGMNGKMTDQLALIETHIKRINGTVRQLVKLARPGGDRWEEIDVGRVLEETVLLISFDPRAHDVDIAFEHPEALPTIHGVPGQLEQVFINLSLNALDAMADGGTLTINARKTRSSIIVRIEDTGYGIPPETGRRIFDPFYTTKEPGKGTGLGLAVSYSIMQNFNGTIEYDSIPGEGTAFTIYLPIINKKPEESHDTGNSSISGR